MKRGKAAGEDDIIADHLNDIGDIRVEKLAILFSECLNNLRVRIAWKNAHTIVVLKKGDVKELHKYRPISQLKVVYKLFTKVMINHIKTA